MVKYALSGFTFACQRVPFQNWLAGGPNESIVSQFLMAVGVGDIALLFVLPAFGLRLSFEQLLQQVSPVERSGFRWSVFE